MSLCTRANAVSGGLRAAPLGALASKRDKSTALGTRGDRLEALRKGTGGRSSFNGVVATVFGASGFLGRYVMNALGKCGTMLVVPYRSDFYDVQRLKVCGDLGQIVFHPFNLKDEKSIAKAMQYSNVVINLIGKDVATRNFTHKDVHVDGARRIARLARESGVEKLIHISALNATEKPKRVCFVSSKFYASKWEGEHAVREEFPEAVILRPSDMYGQEDRFLRYYAAAYRRTLDSLPLWNKGEGIYKTPVFVGDVAKAIVNAIMSRNCSGEIYQAVGPKTYQLGDLVDYIFKLLRRDDGYLRYEMRYNPLFLARVLVCEKLFKVFPTLNFERLEREHTTDMIDIDLKTIAELGVKLTEVEQRFPYDLKYFRASHYYDGDMMRFEHIKPPPPVVL